MKLGCHHLDKEYIEEIYAKERPQVDKQPHEKLIIEVPKSIEEKKEKSVEKKKVNPKRVTMTETQTKMKPHIND